MSGSHRRGPWRYSWLLSLAAVVGITLATAPAYASPAAPLDPAPLLDPSTMVAQVGPTVVDIDTMIGYENAVGAGTGIVLNPNGRVLTNNHVITGATDITVTPNGNGQTYGADVIGYDRTHDIAVLQLRGANGLPTANLNNPSGVRVGDPIVAIGNAERAGGTPHAMPGRVVALNRTVEASDDFTGAVETLNGLIQVDLQLQPGDSGGPMVNGAGQVIGMNTAASANYKLSDGGGESYAIPIGQAISIAGQIQSGAESGTVHIGPTPFLGVGVVDNGGTPGASVQRVLQDAPAPRAGIAVGDVITSVDGNPVNSATALVNILDLHHPGDTIALSWRDTSGGLHTENVTLAAGPAG